MAMYNLSSHMSAKGLGQTFNGFPGSLETKANVLPESVAPLSGLIPLVSLLRAAISHDQQSVHIKRRLKLRNIGRTRTISYQRNTLGCFKKALSVCRSERKFLRLKFLASLKANIA
jgi:hypothetical protein